jgi:hypothetical protein
MSKLSLSGLTASRQETLPVPRPRLDPAKVLDCSYGHYPWDDWHRWAIAQGLDEDLAGLGRLLIREAFNHDWSECLKSRCGWHDNGQRMAKLAWRSPATARRRWQRLLDTDGHRGHLHPETGEWIPNY